MTKANQQLGFYDGTGKPVQRMPNRILPGTSAIAFNERGEVLLQQRSDNGYWGLPGGVVDIGESVEQCVIREVLEETGMRVSVERLIGIYSDPKNFMTMTYPDGNILHTVTATFECNLESGELRISDESTDIGFFPIDSLPDNTMIVHKLYIQDALANSREPFIK